MTDEWEADFTEAEDANFDPLPNGWYEVVLYEAKREVSEKGNKLIAFEFNVLEPEEYSRHKLWLRNTVGGKDKNFFLKKTLTALGVKVGDSAKLDAEFLRDICGSYASVLNIQKVYNNRVYPEIVDIKPAGQGGDEDKPITDDIGF